MANEKPEIRMGGGKTLALAFGAFVGALLTDRIIHWIRQAQK